MKQLDGKSKKYLLELAKKLEKDYPFEAGRIYNIVSPNKGKRFFISIAKKAEKDKLHSIAAKFYSMAGSFKKSEYVWKKYSEYLSRINLNTLASEALNLANQVDPPKPENKKIKKMFRMGRELMYEGKFEKARKHFLETAKTAEKTGQYRYAAYCYMNVGDIENAKRIWKNVK